MLLRDSSSVKPSHARVKPSHTRAPQASSSAPAAAPATAATAPATAAAATSTAEVCMQLCMYGMCAHDTPVPYTRARQHQMDGRRLLYMACPSRNGRSLMMLWYLPCMAAAIIKHGTCEQCYRSHRGCVRHHAAPCITSNTTTSTVYRLTPRAPCNTGHQHRRAHRLHARLRPHRARRRSPLRAPRLVLSRSGCLSCWAPERCRHGHHRHHHRHHRTK